MNTDEQLYKDLEGVLEQAHDMFNWQHQQSNQLITQTQQLTNLYELWDGICHLYSGRSKPGWVMQLLKMLKLFTREAREHAANEAQTCNDLMSKAKGLLGELKGPRIKALFETADIENANGVVNKRQRRTGACRLDL